MTEQIRVISYGGGVQSTALLVLAAQEVIDYHTLLFCNVGDDSEHPATLQYLRDVALPYAADHGLDLQVLQRVKRDGTVETLFERLMSSSKSITIPARFAGSGAPASRNCTVDFKIRVITKWLKSHGATADNPAVSALGISLDEWQRMRTDSGIAWQKLVYPLFDMRLTRADCVVLIEKAGIPVPPKSSCYFCPYHTRRNWQKLRDKEPDLFAKSVELERILGDRNERLHGNRVHLSDYGKPLPMITTAEVQGELFTETTDDNCESGYCFT